jgi:hypothetical protein
MLLDPWGPDSWVWEDPCYVSCDELVATNGLNPDFSLLLGDLWGLSNGNEIKMDILGNSLTIIRYSATRMSHCKVAMACFFMGFDTFTCFQGPKEPIGRYSAIFLSPLYGALSDVVNQLRGTCVHRQQSWPSIHVLAGISPFTQAASEISSKLVRLW